MVKRKHSGNHSRLKKRHRMREHATLSINAEPESQPLLTEAEINELTIRQLKRELAKRCVSFRGCKRKSDYQSRLRDCVEDIRQRCEAKARAKAEKEKGGAKVEEPKDPSEGFQFKNPSGKFKLVLPGSVARSSPRIKGISQKHKSFWTTWPASKQCDNEIKPLLPIIHTNVPRSRTKPIEKSFFNEADDMVSPPDFDFFFNQIEMLRKEIRYVSDDEQETSLRQPHDQLGYDDGSDLSDDLWEWWISAIKATKYEELYQPITWDIEDSHACDMFDTEHPNYPLTPRMAYSFAYSCSNLVRIWSEDPESHARDFPPCARGYWSNENWRNKFLRCLVRLSSRFMKGLGAMPNCTGEEFAFYCVMKLAENDDSLNLKKYMALPESFGKADFQFDKAHNLGVEDLDVLQLFGDSAAMYLDPTHPLTRRMNVTFMNPKDWFRPFRKEHEETHEIRQQLYHWHQQS